MLTKMAFKEFSIYRKSRSSSGVVCVRKVRVLLEFGFPRGDVETWELGSEDHFAHRLHRNAKRNIDFLARKPPMIKVQRKNS